MRRVWWVVMFLGGCAAGGTGASHPTGPAPVSVEPSRLYGRPLELVRETRLVPKGDSQVTAWAEVIRAAAIPGVSQVAANDCGPAAIATLLGFYRLRASGDVDPLSAVKLGMPPQQWGTRIEDARDYLNGTGRLWATAYRDGNLAEVMAIVQSGRPVPVIVTFEASLTRMHWLLVVGAARTSVGERFVLCKNPSESDPLALSAYPEATFMQTWENRPLRSQWWSGLMGEVSSTNIESYRRPYLDCGALLPPP